MKTNCSRFVLLSCLLLLALVAAVPVSARPVPMNAQFMHWQEVSRVIHIFVFADDGRPGQPPALVGAGQPMVFGFEWGCEPSQSVDELQAWIDDSDTQLSVSVDGGPAIDVKGYYQPAFWSVAETGPAWTWDHDGDGAGDGDGDGIGDWCDGAGGSVVFFRYPHPGVGEGTHTFFFTGTVPDAPLEDTITVEAH
jgi:hypothetical protein